MAAEHNCLSFLMVVLTNNALVEVMYISIGLKVIIPVSFITVLAASAASVASPQKHVYVCFISMFVIAYVYMSFGFLFKNISIAFHNVCRHIHVCCVERWVLGFMLMILIYSYPALYIYLNVTQEYVLEHNIHNQSSLHYYILLFGHCLLLISLHLYLFTFAKH
jgi:hypothetical protein